MGLNGLAPDDLIECMTFHPFHPSIVLNPMITIHKPLRPNIPQATASFSSSSVGLLEILPVELMHDVLKCLDFKTLCEFELVSHKGKALLESLQAYRDVIKYASRALIALSRTRILHVHSAASIYAALRSEKCITCRDFAPFLFLPTCERCCSECLRRDRSLRVISTRMASLCFGVSLKNLGQIPILLSVPGSYSLSHPANHRRRTRLVSVKQAKELGITVHGSSDAMKKFVASRNAGKLSHRQSLQVQWLTAPSSAPLPKEELEAFRPNDSFGGMASTAFPSLQPSGKLEAGLWCMACRDFYRGYQPTRPERDAEAPGSGMTGWQRQVHRARSRSEFLEHITECKGASHLSKMVLKYRRSTVAS